MAARGQTVYGRVAVAERAKTNAPSRLGLELTGLTLVDGIQAPLQSQLAERQGGRTTTGEQAGTVLNTTATGAAIGAIADWGTGAAIGAGAGAVAGAIAVILTRNRPTVVYPETALTFRIDKPLTVSTVRSPQAFRYVDPSDYSAPPTLRGPRSPASNAPLPGVGIPISISAIPLLGSILRRRRRRRRNRPRRIPALAIEARAGTKLRNWRG